VARLRAELTALQHRIDEVSRVVPGLREATEEARALEERGADADTRAVEGARLRRSACCGLPTAREMTS
jgi:hypothetical protein